MRVDDTILQKKVYNFGLTPLGCPCHTRVGAPMEKIAHLLHITVPSGIIYTLVYIVRVNARIKHSLNIAEASPANRLNHLQAFMPLRGICFRGDYFHFVFMVASNLAVIYFFSFIVFKFFNVQN